MSTSRRPLALGALLLASLAAAAIAGAAKPRPPVARKEPHVTEVHGERLVDDYYWLRKKDDPEVLAYLDDENAYTDAVTAGWKRLEDKLYREIVARVKQADTTAPYLEKGYWYYTRTAEGKQYYALVRRKGALDAPEEVFLDVDALAEGKNYLALGGWQVSDDGTKLLYLVDETGFRQYRLQIKDLASGALLADTAERVTGAAWAADNRTLLYTVEEPSTKRPYRAYRHALGAPAAQDALVYEEKDQSFELEVSRSRSGAYLFLSSTSLTTTEQRFLPAARPTAAPALIAPRQPNHEYYVDHRGDSFYIRTNSGGRNFRVVTAPVADPGRKHWKELIPHDPAVMLEDIDVFADFMLLAERADANARLRVYDFASGQAHAVAVPEACYSIGPGSNREFAAATFQYEYESPITPPSTFEYDPRARTSRLLKRKEVPTYDAAKYRTERVWAPARDGTRIPIIVTVKKTTRRNGRAPLLLGGYGAYGIPEDPELSLPAISLLDRGFVVAHAQIRGGGDLGKAWHDAGRMMNKMNTFTDFIDAAEYLVAEKWGARDKLVAIGASAGGLLMGAITNLRPDLWRAVVLSVPFVDLMNTMLDASLPLTVPEFEEWGNPTIEAQYRYMKRYSPYDNIAARPYPALLVETSYNDSQVMYWEPSKLVAKLRAVTTGKRPILLRVNMHAGHGGASGRFDQYRRRAFDYAFVLEQVGVRR